MSVTASSMKCPACPDYTLETLSAAVGVFERCPNCSGLFIHQDLVCAASQARTVAASDPYASAVQTES